MAIFITNSENNISEETKAKAGADEPEIKKPKISRRKILYALGLLATIATILGHFGNVGNFFLNLYRGPEKSLQSSLPPTGIAPSLPSGLSAKENFAGPLPDTSKGTKMATPRSGTEQQAIPPSSPKMEEAQDSGPKSGRYFEHGIFSP